MCVPNIKGYLSAISEALGSIQQGGDGSNEMGKVRGFVPMLKSG